MRWIRNFYVRRALRIWPLYYALVVLVLITGTCVRPRMLVPGVHFSWYLFYVQNWFLRDSWGISTLSMSWSLAIEEQFYMSWPLVVWLLDRKRLGYLLAAVLVLSPAARWMAFYVQAPRIFCYTFTLLRLDSIAAGSLLALAVRSPRWPAERLRRWSRIALVSGGAAAVLNLASRPPVDGPSSVVVFSFLAVAFVGAVGISLGVRNSFLENRALRFVGKVSYGLYLLHLAVYQTVEHLPGFAWIQQYGALEVLGKNVALAAVAILSWYLFESPILSLKSHFETHEFTVAPGPPAPIQESLPPASRVDGRGSAICVLWVTHHRPL